MGVHGHPRQIRCVKTIFPRVPDQGEESIVPCIGESGPIRCGGLGSLVAR
jgi:hypothetical protein